jgi:hypothetical protein
MIVALWAALYVAVILIFIPVYSELVNHGTASGVALATATRHHRYDPQHTDRRGNQ